MKTRQSLATIAIVTFALLAMTGCASAVSATPLLPPTIDVPTLAPSPTVTLTPPPTKIMFQYTPPPTLLPDQEQHMAELLQSQDCRLPCYLGITPGRTKLKEARAIVESLGAGLRFTEKNKTNNLIGYSYVLDIGDPSVPKTTPGSSALVYQSLIISATVNDDMVQQIHVGIWTESVEISFETFQDHWARYSAM
jgi:hypothetical protein